MNKQQQQDMERVLERLELAMGRFALALTELQEAVRSARKGSK